MVVALEQSKVVCAGTDHRDRGIRFQREHAVVGEHDDGLARRPPREGPLCRGVEHAAGPFGVDVRALEQPEAELEPEDPPHGLVDHLDREPPGRDLGRQLGEAVGRRQLRVEAGA